MTVLLLRSGSFGRRQRRTLTGERHLPASVSPTEVKGSSREEGNRQRLPSDKVLGAKSRWPGLSWAESSELLGAASALGRRKKMGEAVENYKRLGEGGEQGA